MNFFCSLKQNNFSTKSMLLITFDPKSFIVFQKIHLPIYLLDLSTYKIDYYALTKIRTIIAKILLLLNYECLFSDIDIEYFEPFQQYFYIKQTFDLGFWYEGGSYQINKKTSYANVNCGFIRMFPTKQAISLLNEWILENKYHLGEHDQTCLHFLMQNKSKISCDVYKNPLNHSFVNGFWKCQTSKKESFVWHIFTQQKMISGCEFLQPSFPHIKFFQKKI